MSKPHGTVILCERENGATMAWEDERLSKEMPAGYFVEVWLMNGEVHIASVGDMDRGYQNALLDIGEAVRWCWQESKRERKAA